MTETWRGRLVERIRKEAQPPEKFSHQERLYALTLELGADERYDDDVVFAAAWTHDLGVFVGHRPEHPEALARWDSTAHTLARAPAVLSECGFSQAKIPAAVECIRTHELHRHPQSLEAALLRDADLLEQIGAVAVMRTVAKIGRDTRFVTFKDAVLSLQRALDTVPAALRLPQGHTLAGPRAAALQQFLNAIHEEAKEAL